MAVEKHDGGFMITGDAIQNAQLIARRGALRMETKGMKRRGRSALAIVNELMGTNHRTSKKAYEDLNARMAKAGFKDWPL